MNNFESNESLMQKLKEMLSMHTGRLAQIHHIDTPQELKDKFKKLDKEENEKFVKMANDFYRKNGLRYVAMSGEWARIREH